MSECSPWLTNVISETSMRHIGVGRHPTKIAPEVDRILVGNRVDVGLAQRSISFLINFLVGIVLNAAPLEKELVKLQFRALQGLILC